MIQEILDRAEKFDRIYDILGLSREEYDKLFKQYSEEFKQIVKTGRFVEASIKLLKWLGFDERDIDLAKLVKGLIVMKVLIHYINKSELPHP